MLPKLRQEDERSRPAISRCYLQKKRYKKKRVLIILLPRDLAFWDNPVQSTMYFHSLFWHINKSEMAEG
jgi:hypothetical protein